MNAIRKPVSLETIIDGELVALGEFMPTTITGGSDLHVHGFISVGESDAARVGAILSRWLSDPKAWRVRMTDAAGYISGRFLLTRMEPREGGFFLVIMSASVVEFHGRVEQLEQAP